MWRMTSSESERRSDWRSTMYYLMIAAVLLIILYLLNFPTAEKLWTPLEIKDFIRAFIIVAIILFGTLALSAGPWTSIDNIEKIHGDFLALFYDRSELRWTNSSRRDSDIDPVVTPYSNYIRSAVIFFFLACFVLTTRYMYLFFITFILNQGS